MRIDKKYKIEECATKNDPSRMVLQNILVKAEGAKAYAYATNGRVLAKVPVIVVDGELGKGNSISATDLKFNRSNPAWKKCGEMLVNLEPLEGQFPNTDQVFPQKPPTFTVGMRISNIVAIGKALGTDDLRFEFVDDKSAILIKNNEGGDERALLMPLTIS